MSPAKVLIVNDEPEFCNLSKRVLEGKQYEVDVAYGGEEAIAKVFYFKPTVVILDVMMPQLTGYDLVKMVNAWKLGIQVIMVSAMATRKIREECLANGAFDCLEKPIDSDLLHNTIQAALNSGKIAA